MMSRLSRFGKMKMVEGNPSAEKKFDWGDAIIDAAILSGISFFGALAGTSVVGQASIGAAGIAAALQFLTIIAIKRRLIKE